MTNTTNISNQKNFALQGSHYQERYTSENKSIELSKTSVALSNDEATYSASSFEFNASFKTYTPDMDKVNAMKEEAENKLVNLMKDSIEQGFTKQANALEKALSRYTGDSTLVEGSDITISIKIEITTASTEESSETNAQDDYWSAENTSDRFIEFAKALSGNDSSKVDLFKNAFIKGYEAAEELFGRTLPDVCSDTYDLTLEKFDQWQNEDSEIEETASII
jgi:hypothetical protein